MRSPGEIFLGRGRAKPRKASAGRAINAPGPEDGEVLHTALPDTFDGIRFEIGRMGRYVQEASKDPVVIDTARLAVSQWAKMVEEMSQREGRPVDTHNNKTIQLEGLDIWCRGHVVYVNDPANRELIQTTRRMVKTTKVPAEVLKVFIDPFYRAMELADPSFYRESYTPPQVVALDCDEAAVLICGLAAALDITPVAFRFGGNGDTLHHVWARIACDGTWYDCDLTEPRFQLGDYSDFEHFEEFEVPL